MTKKKLYLTIIIFMIFVPATLLADAFPLLDGVRWNLVSRSEVRSAGMTTVLELNLPPNISYPDSLEIFYQITPWKREGRIRLFEQPQIFKKTMVVESSNHPTISFYSGHEEEFAVWTKVVLGGKSYLAGTFFNNFGRTNNYDTEAKPVESAPNWPIFRLLPGKNYYRIQTGDTLTLEPSPGFLPDKVTVFEEKKPKAVLTSNNNQFSYTPPHDPELAKLDYSAWKSLVFIAELPDEQGQVSFFLPIHRAYRGQTSLTAGLMVLSTSIIISLGWIWLKNKRFKWHSK